MPAAIAVDAQGQPMAAYGEGTPAWHQLGDVVEGAMDAEEVQYRARTGYRVDTTRAFYLDADGQMQEAEGHKAIIRVDTGQLFTFATNSFVPIQNIDVLRVVQQIVDTDEAGWVAHAAVEDGAKLFAVLSLKHLGISIPADPSHHWPYLIATWAHDATESLRIAPYDFRVECANMRRAFMAATEGGALTIRIRHIGDVESQLIDAKRVLGFAQNHFDRYQSLMNTLAETPVTLPFVESFVQALIPIPKDMDRPAAREAARTSIINIFDRSTTLTGVDQTAYRLIQSVDEYADHYRPLRVRDESKKAERRFRQVTDGPAADLKNRAMSLITQALEVQV